MDHQVTDEIWLSRPRAHPRARQRASRAGRAVITGDLMHHPVQIAEPAWQTAFDTDPDAARETRRAFCARYGDRPVTVLGTHFHHPTAGRIVKHGDWWRFAVRRSPSPSLSPEDEERGPDKRERGGGATFRWLWPTAAAAGGEGGARRLHR
jgi:hypothetical protein